MKLHRLASLTVTACFAVAASSAAASNHFNEKDLVSDVTGRAALTDSNLVNPWGIVFTGGVARVADNGTGVSTAYGPAGHTRGPIIRIPPIGSGNPTGVALNRDDDAFEIGRNNDHRVSSKLIFVSEDGTISAYNSHLFPGRAVAVAQDSEAIYKGVAIGWRGERAFLFVANFHGGTIDVFDRRFRPVTTPPHAFTDPDLPAGFAPFNIAQVGGRLFVAYAQQDKDAEDEVAGPGLGYVDVYETSGRLVRRFASQGPLNAPWGMALAPEDFGGFDHRVLLVGNFGDGRINAFDVRSGDFVAALADSAGDPISIQGLWGLAFGPRNAATVANEERDGDDDRDGRDADESHGPHEGRGPLALYFTAGISDEAHGLFGKLLPAAGDEDDVQQADVVKAATTAGANAALRVALIGTNPLRLGSGERVRFSVNASPADAVRLEIYDVAGRLVARPQRESIGGEASFAWDGRNLHGLQVAQGTYLYRTVAGTRTLTGRVVVLR